MSRRWARVFSHGAFTGISRRYLRLVLAEVGSGWVAGREGRLRARRGSGRWRGPGAGRHLELRVADRVVVMLARLRMGLSHEALAVAFGVARSTVARAVGQIRPLLAGGGRL
jgi:hypothetical protein